MFKRIACLFVISLFCVYASIAFGAVEGYDQIPAGETNTGINLTGPSDGDTRPFMAAPGTGYISMR